jgi:phosphoribosyl 1,2-cyclic phosphodiesterase
MAKLKVLGSGSSGNAYIITCKDGTLLVELGIKWTDILQGLEFNTSKVVGCLCSHLHGDHSLSIKNAIKSNLSVYSCKQVASKFDGVEALTERKKHKIGGFTVTPLSVPHSVECYSFIIEHDEFGKLVFCTDCIDLPYKVKGCHHLLCECNWDMEVIIDNAFEEDYVRSMHEEHMEKLQTLEVLRRHLNVDLQNIVLLHMSSSNILPKATRDFMRRELGFNNVFLGRRGLEIELNKSEF